MTIEEAVYSTLSADAAVTALCPAARIKVPGNWQNLAAPYIIHMPVALETIRTHGGLAALQIWQYYQVSIYASTYSDARTLADAVVSALDGVHTIGSPVTDGWQCQYENRLTPGGDPTIYELQQIDLNFRIAEALAA